MGLIVGYWCQSWDNSGDFPFPCFLFTHTHFLAFTWRVFCLSLADVILWRGIIFMLHVNRAIIRQLLFQMSLTMIPGMFPVLVFLFTVRVYMRVFLMNERLWMAVVMESHCLVIPVTVWVCWLKQISCNFLLHTFPSSVVLDGFRRYFEQQLFIVQK